MNGMSSGDVGLSAGTSGRAAAPPYAREASDVAATWGTDPSRGLTSAEAVSRLARYGPNKITGRTAVDPGSCADQVAGAVN